MALAAVACQASWAPCRPPDWPGPELPSGFVTSVNSTSGAACPLSLPSWDNGGSSWTAGWLDDSEGFEVHKRDTKRDDDAARANQEDSRAANVWRLENLMCVGDVLAMSHMIMGLGGHVTTYSKYQRWYVVGAIMV